MQADSESEEYWISTLDVSCQTIKPQNAVTANRQIVSHVDIRDADSDERHLVKEAFSSVLQVPVASWSLQKTMPGSLPSSPQTDEPHRL